MFFFIFITFPLDHVLILWEKILSWSLMEVKELPSLVSKFFNYQSQLSRLSIYLCMGDLDQHV